MNIGTDTYKDLGLATIEGNAPKKKSLGQAEFLKLMTTQMTHQDPTKPMQNGEFLAQMAQFGTVNGIQDLQASFKDFAIFNQFKSGLAGCQSGGAKGFSAIR